MRFALHKQSLRLCPRCGERARGWLAVRRATSQAQSRAGRRPCSSIATPLETAAPCVPEPLTPIIWTQPSPLVPAQVSYMLTCNGSLACLRRNQLPSSCLCTRCVERHWPKHSPPLLPRRQPQAISIGLLQMHEGMYVGNNVKREPPPSGRCMR